MLRQARFFRWLRFHHGAVPVPVFPAGAGRNGTRQRLWGCIAPTVSGFRRETACPSLSWGSLSLHGWLPCGVDRPAVSASLLLLEPVACNTLLFDFQDCTAPCRLGVDVACCRLRYRIVPVFDMPFFVFPRLTDLLYVNSQKNISLS